MAEGTGPISFAATARAPDGVLFRELEGEAVILSVEGGTYYGLDDVGTRMWTALLEAPSIQAGFAGPLSSKYGA